VSKRDDNDPRAPIDGEYGGPFGEVPWYGCPFPGCRFDTLDRAAMEEHLDPVRGAHPEPVDSAAVPAEPVSVDERAELLALREENAALREEAERAERRVSRAKGEATRAKNQLAELRGTDADADESTADADEETDVAPDAGKEE
jgi:hypothetical protein